MAQCNSCNHKIPRGNAVRLWDGAAYCRACLDETTPGLADFARLNPTLCETVPASESSLGRNLRIQFLLIPGLVVAVIGIATASGSLAVGRNVWPLGALFTALVLVLCWGVLVPVEWLFGFPRIHGRLPRTTKVRGGVLVVGAPWKRAFYRLADCRWYVGSTASTDDWSVMRTRPAVIIQLPCGHVGLTDRWVAVGLSPQDRNRWIGLLTLSCCRKCASRLTSPQQIVLILCMTIVVAAAVAIFTSIADRVS